MQNTHEIESRAAESLANSGYVIKSPHGSIMQLPSTVSEDPHARLGLENRSEIRRFYHEQGYVVVRSLIPRQLCEQAYEAFKKEVRSYRGYLYRQTTANPEKHVMTGAGFMLNAILNVQDLRHDRFPGFRANALKILTNLNMQKALTALLGEAPTLVQSMFFEGNPATRAHQDSYYLDSSQIGRMVGVWIAIEEIRPEAGRFFVYPKSHKFVLLPRHDAISLVTKHKGYKTLILEQINKHRLHCVAPALGPGDVLFWGALTVHGSLQTTEEKYSRASFTGHYIPASTQFLQYQNRIKRLYVKNVNGMHVHFPKDQNCWLNRAILKAETTWPSAFQFAKRTAVRMLMKRKGTI